MILINKLQVQENSKNDIKAYPEIRIGCSKITPKIIPLWLNMKGTESKI